MTFDPLPLDPIPHPARSALDRAEKAARLVVWCCLSAACLVVPVGYTRDLLRQAANERDDRERQERDKASESLIAARSERVPIASMGTVVTSFEGWEGRAVFTNVSPRPGIVCIRGMATNAKAHEPALSVPACKRVEAFESTVSMTLRFSPEEVNALCREGPCTISVEDAPERTGVATASADTPAASSDFQNGP